MTARIIIVDVTVGKGRQHQRRITLIGEPVGEWLAITPALAGMPEDAELTGWWTVTHRATGRNAAGSRAWPSIDVVRQYAAEADSLGAEVWERTDLADGWLTSPEGAAARDVIVAAIRSADRIAAENVSGFDYDEDEVVPVGHSQPEPAAPAEAA